MASSLEEDLVCPICLSLFQDPHMLSCGHNFCLACLKGCLSLGAPGAPCPECRLPFQMRDLVRNRALANVARKVRRLERDQGLGALPGEGDFCEEHDEPLKLFCLQDQLPICVICRDLPRHRRHRFLPTKDAVQDAQGKLKPYLKLLKRNLASITRDESLQEKEITTLESLTEDILKDISKGFEVLHQTLHEKEQSFKKIVQGMKEENLKEMKTALASLEEDRASQAETLSNIKAALVTTDHIAFLKDFKNLMDKVQKYPLEEEDKGESSSDEEEASNKNREHSEQEEARNDEEEGDGDELEEDDDELEEDDDELEEDGDELEEDGDEFEEDGDEREYEIEEFGDEKEEEEDEGNVVLVDPALEEFKDNMDFEAWKEMLLQEIMAGKENEEEATDDEPVD
ncbi:nuclear factor 7, brain-like [Anolis sagrei]|uniref:nuclear factor 7, brain-like n=1 Tax=Anolis sagrei TaxID=38937 RepID=UPI00352242E7